MLKTRNFSFKKANNFRHLTTLYNLQSHSLSSASKNMVPLKRNSAEPSALSSMALLPFTQIETSHLHWHWSCEMLLQFDIRISNCVLKHNPVKASCSRARRRNLIIQTSRLLVWPQIFTERPFGIIRSCHREKTGSAADTTLCAQLMAVFKQKPNKGTDLSGILQ